MKVTNIKLIEHVVPNCSCGTGYSEPDKFIVEFDDNSKGELWVDIWYRSANQIRGLFEKSFKETFATKLPYIENLYEAFNMYVDEIVPKSCPYSKDEILNSF